MHYLIREGKEIDREKNDTVSAWGKEETSRSVCSISNRGIKEVGGRRKKEMLSTRKGDQDMRLSPDS